MLGKHSLHALEHRGVLLRKQASAWTYDCSSRDFSAHIAHSSLVMIRYNMLASIKRTLDYDTIGGLFGDMYLGVHELPQKAHIGRVGMAGMPYPQKFGHKKRSPKSLDFEDPK